jgi:hypothetical protein
MIFGGKIKAILKPLCLGKKHRLFIIYKIFVKQKFWLGTIGWAHQPPTKSNFEGQRNTTVSQVILVMLQDSDNKKTTDALSVVSVF